MKISRGGVALSLLAGVSVATLAPGASVDASHLTSTDLPTALVSLGSLVQLCLSVWVLTASGLCILAGQSAVLRAITPQLMRRALFIGAAGALTLSPTLAGTTAPPSAGNQHDVAGLLLPDRPASRAPGQMVQRVVTVRTGDTLWAIAKRWLPSDASDRQISFAVRQWHTTNQAVIGDDPDFIFPSQRLVSPSGKDPS